MTKTIIRLTAAKKANNHEIDYRLIVNGQSLKLTGPPIPMKVLERDIKRVVNKCKKHDLTHLQEVVSLSQSMLIQLLTSDVVKLKPKYYLMANTSINAQWLNELKIGRLKQVLSSFQLDVFYEFSQFLSRKDMLILLNGPLVDNYKRFVDYWLQQPIGPHDQAKFQELTLGFLDQSCIKKLPILHQLLQSQKTTIEDRLKKNRYPELYEALTNYSIPMFHAHIQNSGCLTIRGKIQTQLIEVFPTEFRLFLKDYLEKNLHRNPGVTNRVIAHELLLYPKYEQHCGGYSYLVYMDSLKKELKQIISAELAVYFEKRATFSNGVGNEFWILTQTSPIYKEVIIDFLKIPVEYRRDIQRYLNSHIKVGESGQQLATRFNHLKTVVSHFPLLVGTKQLTDISSFDVITVVRVLESSISPTTGKLYSIGTLRRCLSEMRLLFDYLTQHDLYVINPFRSYIFQQSKSHSIPIKSIPKEVIEQLSLCLPQYNRYLFLVWHIMMWTGVRAGDVTDLTTDSLLFDEEISLYFLTFKLKKTKKMLAKNGISNCHPLPIPKELAIVIKEFIHDTQSIRELTNTKYLFFQRKRSTHLGTTYEKMSTASINNGINSVIKENKIMDASGQLWKFSTHQCRKTLATELLTLGHSYQEVGAVLGHADVRTTKQYYHDIHLQKIASLDKGLFKMFKLETLQQQLDIETTREITQSKQDLLSPTTLSRDGQGNCARPSKLSPCRQQQCVSCPLFITGPEKLATWEQLIQQQYTILIDMQLQLGKDFLIQPSYLEQQNLYDLYQDIVKKILLFVEKG